jgi:hypothetical protein
MNHRTAHSPLTLIAAASLAVAAALPSDARAQDYGAMLQYMQAQSAQLTQTMDQTQNNLIQQAAQNPQIRAGYEQYLAQMRQSGRQPMDFAQYAYYHMYTMGFSSGGIAHMNRVEGGNQAAEMERLRGVRGAEQNRADVMRQGQEHFSSNMQEAGRGLMGQSTYYGQNGYSYQLPHTWQNNSYQNYQGNGYYVDHSGQYFRYGADGWLYPINR